MQLPASLLPLCFLVLLYFGAGCRENRPQPNPALANIDLLRGAPVMCSGESFGAVSFASSCASDAKATFDVAVALLHSFEYEEAEKAFVRVIDMDPDCAMAYWGVSMSIYRSLWMQADRSYLKKGEQLLEIARELPKSDLEQEYIAAISVFYTDFDSKDERTRKRAYERKMAALHRNHPEDTEAAVFYALAILATADPSDKNYTRQIKSGKLLEELFIEHPDHPGIAHYIIHNYDYPELAERALPTARRYAEIAPASAHAQHMPSHIFTRLGLWQESIGTNLNSAASAKCYAESIGREATWAQELHAIDYLVYAYLQLGDNQKAAAYQGQVREVGSVFPQQDVAAAYALAAIPVRIALENKQWENATLLEFPTAGFDWKESRWEAALLHFGRALGFSHTGDAEAAGRELLVLESLHQQLVDAEETYKARQVEVQVHSARGWIALAGGREEEALDHMHQAVILEQLTAKHPITPGELLPADELLGDMLLALNRPVAALQTYESSLRGHPNRFNGLYGAATAAVRTGDTEKAAMYFQRLVDQVGEVGSDRPEVREARDFLNEI